MGAGVGGASHTGLMAAEAVRDGEPFREFVRFAPRLGGMVASAVGYRTGGLTPALHRGLPSPWLTLIFSLDGPVTSGLTLEQARGADAVRTGIVVGALHQSQAQKLPLPELTWTFEDSAEALTIAVQSKPAPYQFRLWTTQRPDAAR